MKQAHSTSVGIQWCRSAAMFLLCAGLLAGGVRAFALNPANHLRQYNCQSWTRQNGLPANGISAITQTADGYLWFGTSIGLIRFNGIEFQVIDLSLAANLQSSVVSSFASARDGGLWVGLGHGSFGYFDGKSFSARGREDLGGLNLNIHSIVEADDRALWLVADDQVARLTSGGQFEPVMSEVTVTNSATLVCGYKDRQARLWVGTANQGVYCWQAGKVTRIADAQLNNSPVFCLAEDLEGNIWVGTADGLFCYDAHLKRREIPPLADEVRALLVDRKGILWIGTSRQGVVRYQNNDYEKMGKPDGLAGSYVTALAEDCEGNLWIGTSEGLSQLSDVKFPTVSAALDDTIKDAIAVGASRRGGIWTASPAGLTYFDGTLRTYTTDDGLPRNYVKRVFEASNGDVYFVSGFRALAVLSEGKFSEVGQVRDLAVGLAEDSSGVVVSAGAELYRAGTNYLRPYVYKGGEKPSLYWVLNLASGRGDVIWIACGNGIFRVHDGEFQPPPPNLAGITVWWVCEDNEGVVWGATQRGIVRLKNGQARFIGRKNGLFDDNVHSVVPDDRGNLWMDSNRGIFRLARSDANAFADGNTDRVNCVAYDYPEAVKVADNTVQEYVACKTADGRIWFPSSCGVVVVDPAHIPVNPVAPPVHIDHVLANSRDLAGGNILVSPGKGDLEIHFDALSFIAPQRVCFRYRLEGYDNDWVSVTNRRIAFYTNLKPGRYTFRVIAANADGVWNERGDTLKIELQPHFYQTTWFGLLCVGLGLAALAGIYGGRVRHLSRKQQALRQARDRLEQEVQNRTAELAQRTRALEREIEERKQMQAEIERVHQQLMDTSRQAGMAEVATNVLHNVGNVLNSVNVSATLAADLTRKSNAVKVAKVVALLDEHADDLAGFMTGDSRGVRLRDYLRELSGQIAREQQTAITELDSLRKNIEHIKDIVSMQQSYAQTSGFREVVKVADLVEDSLRLNGGALQRHGVTVVRDYQEVPSIEVEKYKVLQVLVNLIRNAKYACDEGGKPDKQVTVRIERDAGHIRISVGDNGIGIPPGNLTRIFNHGFTTRKNGHGFGLHSAALAAQEMGGSLTVSSPGLGGGAVFTLTLPVQPETL